MEDAAKRILKTFDRKLEPFEEHLILRPRLGLSCHEAAYTRAHERSLSSSFFPSISSVFALVCASIAAWSTDELAIQFCYARPDQRGNSYDAPR